MHKKTAYIGLGSNLGPRRENLESALRMLREQDGLEVRRVSRFIETDPVGGPPGQGKYLNAVAEVVTTLPPRKLLRALQEIEAACGRNRAAEVRWGPRTCDLDLLLVGDAVMNTPSLTLPHPRMHQRLFVLRPFAELAGHAVHPALKKTIRQLLAAAEAEAAEEAAAATAAAAGEDAAGAGAAATAGGEAVAGDISTGETPFSAEALAKADVLPEPTTLISIIGPPASGKTTLAERLAGVLPAELIREDYAGNPFLAQAYLGRVEARLPSQLYFLMSRVGQLSVVNWPSSGRFVSDYGFCQDRIYARACLSEEEWGLYQRVAERLEGLVRPPDLLIRLEASEPTLLDRIARRGRDFEKVMTLEFLAGMRREYERAADQAACPVLRVDGEAVDFRQGPPLADLAREIRGKLAGRFGIE